MVHARIKRELWRSVAIFFIVMMLFVYLTSFLKGFYWLIFIAPFLAVLIYMGIVIILVRRKSSLLGEIESHPLIKFHRNMVAGLLMGVVSPLLILSTFLFYKDSWTGLIFIPILTFSFCLGLWFFFSSSRKIKSVFSDNKRLIRMQRKSLVKASISVLIIVLSVAFCIIISHVFHFWPIWVIFLIPLIPIVFYLEKIETVNNFLTSRKDCRSSTKQ